VAGYKEYVTVNIFKITDEKHQQSPVNIYKQIYVVTF